jgi:hypothetical protein
MRKALLAMLFSVAVSTAAFAQAGEQLAFADGSTLMNDNDGGNPEDPGVIFYPNPVRTTLNVKFSQRGNYIVKVYNIVGEQIVEKTIVDGDIISMNMSDFNNGMYFLAYEVDGRVYTRTFSKAQ